MSEDIDRLDCIVKQEIKHVRKTEAFERRESDRLKQESEQLRIMRTKCIAGTAPLSALAIADAALLCSAVYDNNLPAVALFAAAGIAVGRGLYKLCGMIRNYSDDIRAREYFLNTRP